MNYIHFTFYICIYTDIKVASIYSDKYTKIHIITKLPNVLGNT